ncbi:MAG: hypothetical protein J6K51_05840 [Clostridia bacterium]|nr:hypothetical protein [Clostridia bacterium]
MGKLTRKYVECIEECKYIERGTLCGVCGRKLALTPPSNLISSFYQKAFTLTNVRKKYIKKEINPLWLYL